jgi:hypothetical protein
LHATAGIERQFDALFDAPGDLLEHWSASLPLIMADPEYVEVMQLRKLAVINADIEGVRPALDAIQQRHLQRVSDGLARAKAEGHVRDDVDPAYVAWMWQGIVFAGCYREALESGGFHAMLPFAERFIDDLRSSSTT